VGLTASGLPPNICCGKPQLEAGIFHRDSPGTVSLSLADGRRSTRKYSTVQLQLNHTRIMLLSDLELQYDQASAALPIIKFKYSNTVQIFLISFAYNSRTSYTNTLSCMPRPFTSTQVTRFAAVPEINQASLFGESQ
jgi:hypothetical protein